MNPELYKEYQEANQKLNDFVKRNMGKGDVVKMAHFTKEEIDILDGTKGAPK